MKHFGGPQWHSKNHFLICLFYWSREAWHWPASPSPHKKNQSRGLELAAWNIWSEIPKALSSLPLQLQNVSHSYVLKPSSSIIHTKLLTVMKIQLILSILLLVPLHWEYQGKSTSFWVWEIQVMSRYTHWAHLGSWYYSSDWTCFIVLSIPLNTLNHLTSQTKQRSSTRLLQLKKQVQELWQIAPRGVLLFHNLALPQKAWILVRWQFRMLVW